MDHEELATQAMKALRKDISFWKEAPLGTLPVLEELVAAIPDVLGDDLLNAPANLAGIAKAKLAIIRHALETGFVTKFMDAAGMEIGFGDMLESAMRELAGSFQSLAEDALATLREAGISEEFAMQKMGLDRGLVKKCRRGLTVGELFRDHPAIIIQNT